jgi:hypothetical protein
MARVLLKESVRLQRLPAYIGGQGSQERTEALRGALVHAC